MTLTAERLREVLAYDPDTGVFVWLTRPHNQIASGSTAGGVNSRTGYRRIKVDGTHYAEHRLAWLYVHGVWPRDQTDHVDMDKTNNRLDNLREATSSQNKANIRARPNNKSGAKGVSRHGGVNWRARICVYGRQIDLGRHRTKEEAGAAYAEAARLYYGEFARSA